MVVGLSKDEEVKDREQLRVGVTTYENFYSHEELKTMEVHIEETEKKSLESKFSASDQYRCIPPNDCLEEFRREHTEKDKVLLRVQIHVDQDSTQRASQQRGSRCES